MAENFLGKIVNILLIFKSYFYILNFKGKIINRGFNNLRKNIIHLNKKQYNKI